MKTNKKKEQFYLAEALLEMGLEFQVIETISGVNMQELLLHQINMLEFNNSQNKKRKNK